MSPFARRMLHGLALLALAGAAPAQVRTFTLDWPPEPGRALPVWLDRPVAETHEATATLQIPLSPTRDATNLALTLWFDEPAGGFLRVLWVTASSQTTLCQNLYEGTGLPNRRTLLLTPEQLTEPGVLTVQASGASLPITRLRWEWLEPTATLAALDAPVPEVILGEGQTPAADELLGDPYLPLEDAWRNEVITASLTDRVERIESGTGFIAPLELAPEQARLEMVLAGLPASGSVRLRVNGADAGALAVELPDLADPSYRYAAAGRWIYSGWRKATAAIPATLLHSGDNLIELIWIDPQETPLALKDLLLQLRYPSTASPAQLGAAPDLTDIEPAPAIGGQ